VKLRLLLTGLTILLAGTTLRAQISGDAIGVHNLGPGGGSPRYGARPDFCAYCHAPHSGLNIGLWNQKLTTQSYTLYASTTEANTGMQPVLNHDSNECLSCHDGTVGVGNTVAYGQVTMTGTMFTADVFGSNMQPTHPFSLVKPLKTPIDVAAVLRHGRTLDTTGAVRMIQGNVECTSCHNPHVQAKDTVSLNFLVKDSSLGAMCLACHDPTRQIGSQVNPLADWTTSIHNTNTGVIASGSHLGSYGTVQKDACIACHAPHNGSGAARLLRAQNELDCLTCHNGGTTVSPMLAYANVGSEYQKRVIHPLPTSTYPHDANEPTLLEDNRHATCVDCHAPHASQNVGTAFPPPPQIRISQKDIAGIYASDGTSVRAPAVYQYENCLRCHGLSTYEQSGSQWGYLPAWAVSYSQALDVIPQFLPPSNTLSSHPVMQTSYSTLTQFSLRTNMTNQNGSLGSRVIGNQILCTDCHNSNDNREFGGTGANGPHGSIYDHLLERQYVYNTPPTTAGGTVGNLQTSPVLDYTGPYALCDKCHDLSIVNSSTSWSGHLNHLADGFSCATCHNAHGLGAVNSNFTGQRLVDFDLNIVAANPNYSLPISYTYGSPNTCVLACHNYAHNPDGSVSRLMARKRPGTKK